MQIKGPDADADEGSPDTRDSSSDSGDSNSSEEVEESNAAVAAALSGADLSAGAPARQLDAEMNANKLPEGFDDSFDDSNMQIMVDKGHFSDKLSYQINKAKKEFANLQTKEGRALMYERDSKTEAEKLADVEFQRKLSAGFYMVAADAWTGCDCCQYEYAYINATHLPAIHARRACAENDAYLAVVSNYREQELVSRLVVGGQVSEATMSLGRQLAGAGESSASDAKQDKDSYAVAGIESESEKADTAAIAAGATKRELSGHHIPLGEGDVEEWVWIGASRIGGQMWNFQWENPSERTFCSSDESGRFKNFANWRHIVPLGGANFASISREDGAWEVEVPDHRSMGYVSC